MVIFKFVIASLFMWLLPLLVLQVFKRELLPGISELSPRVHTLWSGCLAVLSVNIVIVAYIILALREPANASAPKPDPAFVSKVRASLVEAAEQPGTEAKKTE